MSKAAFGVVFQDHGRISVCIFMVNNRLGCGVVKLGCGVAQIIARRLAVRQARVRISARHPRGGPLLLNGSDEDNKKRFSTSYI
jgi:hypothetical protein